MGASSTFSGVIEDGTATTALTQNSVGNTLTLTGANTYSGPTTVEAGTLKGGALNTFSAASTMIVQQGGTLDLGGYNQTTGPLSYPGGAGTGAITNNGSNPATLTVQTAGTTSFGFDGVIEDGASKTALAVAGNSHLYLGGANIYTGGTSIDAGGYLVVETSIKGPITNDGLLFFFVYGATKTFDGTLTGDGFVAAQGNGTLILTGANTNSQINVDPTATLQIGNGGTTGSLTANVFNGGAVVFDRSDNYTYGGVVSGPGTLTQAGAGALTLTGANTYGGATTVQSGTLKGGATNAFSAASATTVDSGATLDLGGFNQTVSSLSGGGTVTNSGPGPATLTNQGAASTFWGVIEDGSPTATTSLTQNSVGNTLTLSGVNTYTGATTISAGTLALKLGSIATSSGVFLATGATFDVSNVAGDAQIKSVGDTAAGQAGKISLNDNILTITNGSTTFSGVIDDGGAGGSLVVAGGTQTLAGKNTYTGPTTISGGTLALFGTGSISNSSGVYIATGATFDISQTTAGASIQTLADSAPGQAGAVKLGAQTLTIVNGSTFSGAITDGGIGGGTGGSLVIAGGTQTLAGTNNTYTGTTTIDAGATLKGGATDAFSPFSAMTVQTGAMLDLGGYDQAVSSLSGGGTVTNSGASFAQLNNTGPSSTFSGSIEDGAGGVVLNQYGGTLTLSGTNTYSGVTTISAGSTLKGGAQNAFSAASEMDVGNGGTLDLGGFNQVVGGLEGGGVVTNSGSSNSVLTLQGGGTFAGVIQNGASNVGLILQATADLTLTGANTYTGGTTIGPSSILQIGNGGTTGSIVGDVVDDGALVFDRSDAVTFAGAISGAGSVTQQGSGVLTLAGNNTYSGVTDVVAGTLKAGAANALSATSPIAVDAGATLDLGGFSQSISYAVALDGGTIQNGALVGEGATGIRATSGGTIDEVSISVSGTMANALHASGFGQLNLAGTNTFTAQGDTAFGILALGGNISATGQTNVTATGANARGISAGLDAQVKLSSASITVDGAGAYGLYANDPTAGASISATGTLNVVSTGANSAAIALKGNDVSVLGTGGGTITAAADAIQFLAGTNQTATFDSFAITGNVVTDPASTANLNLNNGSTFTGSIDPANVTLTNSTWNLTASSIANNLTVTNSSIVFAPPTPFKTLTIGGAYVGSGANITLNTYLGGSSSPTDQIVVNGGTATGLTSLTIKNAGGPGAQTTGNGIPIVVTTGGGTTAANAFALSSDPVLNGYRYSLVDPGGDWYLVSTPTSTTQQIDTSVNNVAKAQLGQIVNGGLLSSILLGATQQVSCSSCASGFGAIGSFALGTQGRVTINDHLTAIGGFSYNEWSSGGITVNDAPTFAGALVYDFSNFGSSRPFVEAGGALTPYESIRGSRDYQNGPTTSTGTWNSIDRNLALFARAGWLARLTPTDEAAAYADFGRNWLQTGGYTEAAGPLNPYPASVSSALQALNVVRVGGQYTHLFGDKIEVNVSGAVAHGFGAGNGPVFNVTDFGQVGPSALPTSTWFEYGARIGYRVSDRMVVDGFVLGAAGGEAAASVHGGIAFRFAF